jgi:hypothetical protein
MAENTYVSVWMILFLLILSVSLIPAATMADDVAPSPSTVVRIFDGSIPSGDGVVSIKAVSGKLYQIPTMSPLGVIQALAGTDIIESYKIGDELKAKMGILTLDAINGITISGDNSWFVMVNDKQLEDYQLPVSDALNLYKLKNGDIVLFVYGNPTQPVSEASKSLRIVIGSQSGESDPVVIATPEIIEETSYIQTVVTPESVSEYATDVVEQPIQEITPEPEITLPIEPEIEPEYTPLPSSDNKDANLPSYGDEDEEDAYTPSSSGNKDANLPSYGDEDEEDTYTPSSSGNKDANLPSYGDDEEEDAYIPSSSGNKDANLPSYGDDEEEDAYTPSSSGNKDANLPSYGDDEEEDAYTPSSSGNKDANLPSYGDDEEEDAYTPSSSGNKDANLPSYGDNEEEDNNTPSSSDYNDSNLPSYGDDEEDEESGPTESLSEKSEEPIEDDRTDEEDTEISSEQSSTTTSKSGQTVFFDGTRPLSSGSINLTAESGAEYDVSANTPLGLLFELFEDGKVPSIRISDRGFNKGGILTLTSIEEYQWGEEAWFVVINGQALQDYFNPGTDGLNIRVLKSGDKVTYYYGTMDQSPATAKAAIYVTID